MAALSQSLRFADHQDRERAWNRRRTLRATSAGGCRRGRSTLIAHREDVVRLAVERDCPSAIHRLQILFHLEAGRAILLDDGQRAVALSAKDLHGRWVEDLPIRTAGEWELSENLTVLGTENNHHRLRLITRPPTGGEKHAVLRVEGEAVARSRVAEGIVRDGFHGFGVHDGD